MRKAIAVVGSLALAACVSAPGLKDAPKGRNLSVREKIDYPDLGSVSEAKIGEDILRQGTYTETRGIELPEPNKIDSYRLSPGFYPQIADDENYTYHSFRERPNREGYGYIPPAYEALFKDLVKAPSAIRVAKHKQQTCVIVRDFLASFCDTEHPYKRVVKIRLTSKDLQQKLVYRGRDGDRILIGYSEASGHFARPEHSSEAEYDIASSDEITYKGARIKVLQADESTIRYKVLSKLTGW